MIKKNLEERAESGPFFRLGYEKKMQKRVFWTGVLVGSWALYQQQTPKPIPFKLTEKIMISESTGLFKFTFPTQFNSVSVPYHLLFIDESCQIARAYSPLVLSNNECQVLIKRYPHGSLSTKIHDLFLGETIGVLGPFSTIQLPKSHSHIGMVNSTING